VRGEARAKRGRDSKSNPKEMTKGSWERNG